MALDFEWTQKGIKYFKNGRPFGLIVLAPDSVDTRWDVSLLEGEEMVGVVTSWYTLKAAEYWLLAQECDEDYLRARERRGA